MIAPSIQLAPGMSAENITSSVHAFETGVGTGASFAEHLDRAVQSSPRPETQPSDSRSTTPKPASYDTQTQRRQATGARPTASQTKQNSGITGKTSTSDQALNSDRVQKDDEQRQPANGRNRDSQSSDDSRNAAGRQAGDEETPAKGKSRFAQAIAQSAASQSASAASSATQPAETSTQPSDASIPAALLALLQAAIPQVLFALGLTPSNLSILTPVFLRNRLSKRWLAALGSAVALHGLSEPISNCFKAAWRHPRSGIAESLAQD